MTLELEHPIEKIKQLQPKASRPLAVTGSSSSRFSPKLLLNAADDMSGLADHPRELVVCTGRDEDGAVRVSVQGCGLGSAPGDGERQFETLTKQQGIEIGLSVSRSILERHRGL